ncbi:MAG: hypothetical protein COA59_17435 [Colwellia sp.]|nr:MAG: hypothetical protein COA59_17435 [Colwellia sp.]
MSEFLRGWLNFYGIANAYQACVELDHCKRQGICV